MEDVKADMAVRHRLQDGPLHCAAVVHDDLLGHGQAENPQAIG